MAERVIYKRADGKWAWRLKGNNGVIVATDGSQGYENESDARAMADYIIAGGYKDAKKSTLKPSYNSFAQQAAEALFNHQNR